MCLIVKQVPYHYTHGLSVISYKVLELDTRFGKEFYKTPFEEVAIPGNGLLVACSYGNPDISPYYGKSLGRGVIHSFCKESSTEGYLSRSTRRCFKSYAIKVVAYGTLGRFNYRVDNIASLCLYIPELDKTSNNAIKKLRLDACENPTTKKLKEAFKCLSSVL